MNLRFPEVFGLLLFLALLSSLAMPRSLSGRIENSFQFVFAPIAGPIQWVAAGKESAKPHDVPLMPAVSDEVQRLRQEKAALLSYTETLHGQLLTLRKRQEDAEAVGEKLSDHVTAVKVIAVDAAAGREVLRLSGTLSSVPIAKGQAVVAEAGLVGKIQDVGVGRQSSVQLITDKGFKLIGRFGRITTNGAGAVELVDIPLGTTLIVGAGGGMMRAEALTTIDVQNAGLKLGDVVFLGDTNTEQWPIEVHGRRVGTVAKIGEKIDAPGVAEVWVKPDVDLMKLKDVLVVTGK